MITIILIDKNRQELSRVSEKSNFDYLIREEGWFDYLTSVDEYSPSLFRRNDMQGLINELLLLKDQLSNPEHIRHIDDIVQLARRCQQCPETALFVTPWGELYGRVL